MFVEDPNKGKGDVCNPRWTYGKLVRSIPFLYIFWSFVPILVHIVEQSGLSYSYT